MQYFIQLRCYSDHISFLLSSKILLACHVCTAYGHKCFFFLRISSVFRFRRFFYKDLKNKTSDGKHLFPVFNILFFRNMTLLNISNGEAFSLFHPLFEEFYLEFQFTYFHQILCIFHGIKESVTSP